LTARARRGSIAEPGSTRDDIAPNATIFKATMEAADIDRACFHDQRSAPAPGAHTQLRTGHERGG